jgi:aspartate racemase|tara:strand:+ start:16695 stop:17363 length:669 start_codon:yes stop_codon:yes gene_type:complete
MNKLGILGLGSYSTAHYIQKLNSAYHKEKGGFSTAPFVMLNVDFDSINPYLPDQFDEVVRNILGPLKELESYGITHLLVPNITLHESLDKIKDEFQFEIIHPLPLLIDELKRNQVEKATLFGTKYTMNSLYLNRFLAENSIEVVKQSDPFEQQIDEIRMSAYEGINCLSQFTVLESLISNDTAIVIACTELSILNVKKRQSLVFDLSEIQIKRATELLLQQQ